MEFLGGLERLLVRGQSLRQKTLDPEHSFHPGHFQPPPSPSLRRGGGRWGWRRKSPRLHLNWVDDLADGASLLGSQVQGLVLLALVELPQVLLLLLVHHDVDAGDGLPDHADLGELGGGAAGDLGHAELGQLSLEVIQLLGQVFLLLLAKLRALDLTHR